MNQIMTCEDIPDATVQALLDGILNKEEEHSVKAHIRGCSDCNQRFMTITARGVFDAQIRLRTSNSISWSYLNDLVNKGAGWAKAELERARNAVENALPIWDFATMNFALAGPHMGESRIEWSISNKEEVIEILKAIQQHRQWTELATTALEQSNENEDVSTFTVATLNPLGQNTESDKNIDIVLCPTITKDGNFVFAVYANATHLEGAKFVCTVTGVENVKIAFEGDFKPGPQDKGWTAMIDVEGLPEPEDNIVIPREQIEFHIQTTS